jgi:hypothetical protein
MIEQKKKLCNNCNTEQFIWKNDKGSKYCKYCWYKSKEPSTKPLQRKPINKKSKKMQVIDQAYTKLRKPFMEANPMCQAALHCCSGSSTDVHHKKKRGEYHLVVSTWLSVCRNCHNWIEEHPEEAIELGYSLKRNSYE